MYGVQSALLGRVKDIIGVRSKKEMLWIYAGWIIATMANFHAIWDRTDAKLVTHTMCKFTAWFNPKSTVA